MPASLRSLAARAVRNFKNVRGWTTGKKIVVFESDDWGSIRLPSREVYERFVNRGYDVSREKYNRFDALESNDDLISLLEVLKKYQDRFGNRPCLTANIIMANPDFDRIRRSHFEHYYYEHFTRTLETYPKHKDVFVLYQQGIKEGLFRPQFHGREHLNVGRWMKALKGGSSEIMYTFDQHSTYSGRNDYNFMEALDLDDPADPVERNNINKALTEGLQLFRETFGYESRSFIAPCYTWDSAIEPMLSQMGVSYIQGGLIQYIPKGGFDNYGKRFHYPGQHNANSQVYLIRNCFFEPSLVSKPDWVDFTLSNIADAFRWKKPAVVCAHRINFIGFIDENNRNTNLMLFDQLLARIVKAWPDVEFMTSDTLGDTIRSTS